MLKQTIMVVAVVLILTTVAYAESKAGAYVSIKGAYSLQEIEDPSLSAFGQQWNFSDKRGSSAAGGLAVGYRFGGPIRLEVEYLLRNTADVDWSGDQGLFMSGPVDWSMDLEVDVDTLLFSLFYDFENTTPITPYVSAGAGWSFIDASLKYRDDIGTPTMSSSEDRSNFVWSIGLDVMSNQ